jgi:hypothetical protein
VICASRGHAAGIALNNVERPSRCVRQPSGLEDASMSIAATRTLAPGAAAAALLTCSALAGAQELAFAPAAEAREILSSKDTFVERMSGFDRAARLKTDRAVTESEYLRFARAAALDWEESEKRAIAAAYDAIRNDLERLHLPLPPRILVVKTTGQEEGDTSYTRANAIVLPRRHVRDSPELQKTLAHELFHVASRSDPALAEKLYATIGFHPCGEAVFPPSLAPRKLTNPDAPRNDYCIRVKLDGREVAVTPILFSRSATYDPARGGEFFEYLLLGLLIRDDAAAESRAADTRVAQLNQVSGFFEQVGRNTQYVIHPEEILADNFSLMVIRAPAMPSPEIPKGIERVLAEAARQLPRKRSRSSATSCRAARAGCAARCG